MRALDLVIVPWNMGSASWDSLGWLSVLLFLGGILLLLQFVPQCEERGMELLLLMRRAPRVLGGGPSAPQHLLGVGLADSEWG